MTHEEVRVERVRLDKETVTAQEPVTEEVREEKVELLDNDAINTTKNKR